MYDAIVNQGQCVVVSFNQLTDSLAFLGPILSVRTEHLFELYLKLIQNGHLKISRYIPPNVNIETENYFSNNVIRTAAQYVLKSLESAINNTKKSSAFIFSSLPISKDNTPALQKVYDAIRYCDLTLVDKLVYLGISDPDCQYIKRYVKWILELSAHSSGYTEVKTTSHLSFPDCTNAIIELKSISASEKTLPANFADAHKILIRAKPKADQDPYSRSVWFNNIEQLNTVDQDTVQLAKAIINLCYNISVEGSICGIDKDYHNNLDAFISEFIKRLPQETVPKQKNQVLTIEPNEFPDWNYAVRITKESNNVIEKEQNAKHLHVSKTWHKVCQSGQLRKLGRSLSYFLLFLILDFLFGFIEDFIGYAGSEEHNTVTFLVSLVQSFLQSFVFSAVVTSIISFWSSVAFEKLNVPDIKDIFRNVKEACTDYTKLVRNKRQNKKGNT